MNGLYRPFMGPQGVDSMVYLIINWVLSTLCLLLAAVVLPGFRMLDFGSALIACGTVGLISALLGMVLKHVTGIAAVVMSATFLLVADAFLFRLSGLLVPGFAMLGFAPAFVGAALLLTLNLLLLRFVPVREEGFDSHAVSRS